MGGTQMATNLQRYIKPASIFVAALVMAVVTPLSGVISVSAAGVRQQYFAEASAEFGVPQEVLLAVSYNQSRWENHAGQPSVGGGYGLMHLTTHPEPQDGRGDPSRPLVPRDTGSTPFTLDAAAALIDVPAETLKHDDRQNVRAAAALMADFVKEDSGVLPVALSDWYGPVTRISGMNDDAQAQQFAANVFASIRSGAARTTSDGQQVTLRANATAQSDTGLFGLRTLGGAGQSAECPRTITCTFVPARFAQNNPENPKDYGNYDTANRPQDMKVKYIVIHDTEGSYESAISWFQDPRSYVAAHYVIRSADGDVTQMVKNKDVGWHAGNWYMNMHSIGIEHEGFAAEGAAWYTDAMYQASAKLVRYLAKKYDIPLDRDHIVGHDEYHGLTPARAKLMHNDPGPYWDWEYYMELLRADPVVSERHRSNAVTIAPRFAQNKPPVSVCADTVCTDQPAQPANFVYLRTAPRDDAPYLTDAGLHPDGAAGTTEINDWSAKVVHGQEFAVAGKQGNWTAIWFGGQRGWFYNPWNARTAVPTRAKLVTPKAGLASVPVYGRPVPEQAAYANGVPPLTVVPLQYSLFAGQSYPAYDHKAINDYYHVLTFDRSSPGDGTLVIGHEKYVPIEYNHRQAFVKASDVEKVN
jgi:N-acetyl-anhydromuramyl-L-alanine amidase AmpD